MSKELNTLESEEKIKEEDATELGEKNEEINIVSDDEKNVNEVDILNQDRLEEENTGEKVKEVKYKIEEINDAPSPIIENQLGIDVEEIKPKEVDAQKQSEIEKSIREKFAGSFEDKPSDTNVEISDNTNEDSDNIKIT